MKKQIVAVAIIFGFIAGSVQFTTVSAKKKPPKKKVVIKGCKQKKPPVVFDHPKHVKWVEKAKMDCKACHHLVEKKPATKDRCSDCHLKKRGKLGTCKDKSPKKNPFHKQCIGCHKKMFKSGASAKKGPTKCKQCHPK